MEHLFANKPAECQSSKIPEGSAIFRQILDSSTNGFIVDNEQGQLIYANASFLKLFGFPADTDPNTIRLEDYIHSSDHDKLIERHHRRMQGETVPSTFEYRGNTTAGDTVNVTVQVTPIKNGEKIVGTYSEVQNVSERNLLLSRVANSESRVKINRLSAGIAHELKNPLAAIKGFANLISIECDFPEIKEMSDTIENAAGRMEKIIDQLQLFNRRNHRYYLEPISMGKKIESTLARLDCELNLAGITVLKSVSNHALIIGDRFFLENALENLLRNAIEALEHYPIKEKIISINLDAVNGFYKIEISDNGPGISNDMQSKIFEPFFTTKDVGKGTGLGLSVTNEIIRNHGGTLAVTANALKGSTFTLMLPRAEASACLPMKTPERIFTGIKRKVLCIDDDRTICMLLKKMLECEFDVETIDDPMQAIALAERGFDLIITDLKMPLLSGLEVISLIKRQNPHATIALATACNEHEKIVIDSLELGACGIIKKPFLDRDTLLETINKMIDNSTLVAIEASLCKLPVSAQI